HRDRRPAGLFVPRDVAAHTVEVVLLELSRERRVSAGVMRSVPDRASLLVARAAHFDPYVARAPPLDLGGLPAGERGAIVIVHALVEGRHALAHLGIAPQLRPDLGQRVTKEAPSGGRGGIAESVALGLELDEIGAPRRQVLGADARVVLPSRDAR